MAQEIMLYGRPACPGVEMARRVLDRAGIGYRYIDIYATPAARERVHEINHGAESVPTLIFPDGSSLTEPSLGELRTKLHELGYEIPNMTWLDRAQLIVEHPFTRVLGVICIMLGMLGDALGLLSDVDWLLAAGVVILAAGLLLGRLRR